MKQLITLILLISSISSCYPCDCKAIDDLASEQINSYENNELIFIGEVISSDDDGFYKLRVVEVLKGQKGITTIQGKSRTYCSLVPRIEDGLWLIYANPFNDGTIDIMDCGLSRSFNFPYVFSPGLSAPPPPPRTYNDETLERIELEHKIIASKAKLLEILKSEIADLREKRE